MSNLFKLRNGQVLTLANFGSIAIAIVVAVIVLGLGSTILEKIQATQTDDTGTYVNQSFTWQGNDTAVAFAASRVVTSSVVVYANVTVMGLDVNYTVNASGVAILNQTAAASVDIFNLLLYNMTYSYKIGGTARNSTDYGITGLVTMAEFIPTVAIIAAAGIIIGVLLLFFGRKKD